MHSFFQNHFTRSHKYEDEKVKLDDSYVELHGESKSGNRKTLSLKVEKLLPPKAHFKKTLVLPCLRPIFSAAKPVAFMQFRMLLSDDSSFPLERVYGTGLCEMFNRKRPTALAPAVSFSQWISTSEKPRFQTFRNLMLASYVKRHAESNEPKPKTLARTLVELCVKSLASQKNPFLFSKPSNAISQIWG